MGVKSIEIFAIYYVIRVSVSIHSGDTHDVFVDSRSKYRLCQTFEEN